MAAADERRSAEDLSLPQLLEAVRTALSLDTPLAHPRSLRDEIAIATMAELLKVQMDAREVSDALAARIATDAYAMADAMLRARAPREHLR